MDRAISDKLIEEWQGIVDLLTRILNVPAALIMHINEGDIEVFVSSHSDGNPYHVGDKEHLEGSGLYCERVIQSQDKLLVPNALESAEWRNNPDVKLNMISYLGFPIRWPDGTPFGTICVLDNEGNEYSSDYADLLEKFRNVIEDHLEFVETTHRLERLADADPLTGLLNQRAFHSRAEIEIDRARRFDTPLSLMILDMDRFKQINDRFGHPLGDDALIRFADQIKTALRKRDLFGRLGGDEFIILLPDTSLETAQGIGERLRAAVEKIRIPHEGVSVAYTVSIGITEKSKPDTYDAIVKRADKALYQAKESGRNRVCVEPWLES
ncbi:MAG: GGDEF domain-containing protein [Anaerolineales bacterium]|nr:GGDEF domain-containing protein [Anaerolineales bacterium]